MDRVKKILLKRSEERKLINNLADFRQGDEIRVHAKVKEGQKERIQVFQGVVIKVQGRGLTRAFTVRKMSFGVGVERTFPFNSTKIEKVEVVKRGKTRRSRLYYLRNLRGRAARLQSELVTAEGKASKAAREAAEAASAPAPAPKEKAEASKEEASKTE